MARKPSKRGNRPDMDAEINLLPVLNLMVGLIPPLLLMASFLHLAIIDSALPKISRETPQDTPPDRIPLIVTVEMQQTQLKTTFTGGITRAELKKVKRGQSTCGDNIVTKVMRETEPGTREMVYDWEKFSAQILAIKVKNPDDESVILRPVDPVTYDELIKAMDYTRVCHPDIADKNDKECHAEKDGSVVAASNLKPKRLLFPSVNMAFAMDSMEGLTR